MENHVIRLLKANEIECRVSIIKENGLSLLLYKDARVDQRILDETFGPFGWKRSHQCIDGNLYCTVEIYDKTTGEWVSKQDVGTMGYAEKEKSQASDSFKRACFNWGIGRELYTAPFIWIPSSKANISKREGQGNRENSYYCSDHFSVREIGYNGDREIVSLTVVNDTNKGQAVYELAPKINYQDSKTKKAADKTPGTTAVSGISDMQMHSLEAELQRTGVNMEAVKDRYKIDEPKDMTEEIYGKIMKALAKTKSADAA